MYEEIDAQEISHALYNLMLNFTPLGLLITGVKIDEAIIDGLLENQNTTVKNGADSNWRIRIILAKII